MKKTCLIILLFCIACCGTAYAQKPEEAFYIIRNDGHFNVFFRNEVDSITYSNYDENGTWHDEHVMQVIHCKDSICKIPLAVVDSVVIVPSDEGSTFPMGWSDQASIIIPAQPACAMVNITGITALPSVKGTDAHAWMEVWDMQGIYFKKRVLIDLNGDSSTAKEKRNFSVDFCEDEWEGNETTDIKIGNWVTQDGFHFKAFYTSITKGECPVCYKLYDKMLETKPLHRRAPFMEYYDEIYLTNILGSDDKLQKEAFTARCYPDGFPCIVFLNNQFYGIYSWQLKKHRDNYQLSRNAIDDIHLDGNLGPSEIWNQTVKWSSFEVRNPKPKKGKWTLLCQDNTVYDGALVSTKIR